MVKYLINQGDILKVENISKPVLVVSKNFFNETGEVIACPIYDGGNEGALHIPISGKKVQGVVHCEKMNLFDMSVRGFSKTDTVGYEDIINISDAIQGIFDYV